MHKCEIREDIPGKARIRISIWFLSDEVFFLGNISFYQFRKFHKTIYLIYKEMSVICYRENVGGVHSINR